MRGRFIVFEGIDGAGKSTQLEALQRYLEERGHQVLRRYEPTHERYGRELRRLMVEGRERPLWRLRELYLFVRDRWHNVRQHITPALRRGQVVLQDRYFYSTITYQGALGIPQWFIRACHAWFPRADLVLLLDLPPEVGRQRIEEGRGEQANEFEGLDYLREVRRRFLELPYPEIVRIDATADSEAVSARIRSVVRERLGL